MSKVAAQKRSLVWRDQCGDTSEHKNIAFSMQTILTKIQCETVHKQIEHVVAGQKF
jgi:hypothetical protein